MKYGEYGVPRHVLKRRAWIVWMLTFLGALTVLPLLVVLPLAYFWRKDAIETRYESHFNAISRTIWIAFALLIVSVILLMADLIVGVWVLLIAGIFLITVAVAGLRRASEERAFPPLIYLLGVRTNRSAG